MVVVGRVVVHRERGERRPEPHFVLDVILRAQDALVACSRYAAAPSMRALAPSEYALGQNKTRKRKITFFCEPKRWIPTRPRSLRDGLARVVVVAVGGLGNPPHVRSRRRTRRAPRPSPSTRRGAHLVVRGKKGKKGGGGSAVTARPSADAYVTVAEDGSDDRRLDEIASLIREGHVGIIPTDTKYALVCDLESRAGVQTLYDLKGAGASKPMSIPCRGFSDIDKYTQGFPDNVVAGRMQAFKIAKKCLPGPYTFILNAGKELPKVCLADPKSKSKTAKRAKPSACASRDAPSPPRFYLDSTARC